MAFFAFSLRPFNKIKQKSIIISSLCFSILTIIVYCGCCYFSPFKTITTARFFTFLFTASESTNVAKNTRVTSVEPYLLMKYIGIFLITQLIHIYEYNVIVCQLKFLPLAGRDESLSKSCGSNVRNKIVSGS